MVNCLAAKTDYSDCSIKCLLSDWMIDGDTPTNAAQNQFDDLIDWFREREGFARTKENLKINNWKQ